MWGNLPHKSDVHTRLSTIYDENLNSYVQNAPQQYFSEHREEEIHIGVGNIDKTLLYPNIDIYHDIVLKFLENQVRSC